MLLLFLLVFFFGLLWFDGNGFGCVAVTVTVTGADLLSMSMRDTLTDKVVLN